MADAPSPPTRELIESGSIIENQFYDYKASVDLGDPRAKSSFIDDVVAFLNVKPGHIIIGVVAHKKSGAWQSYQSIKGDKDFIRRQFTSCIQDNIDPKPIEIGVEFIDVDDGFLITVQIPKGRWSVYQNKTNGAIYARTGAQNTPLPLVEIRGRNAWRDRWSNDLIAFTEREDSRVDAAEPRDADWTTFHLGVLPRDHYVKESVLFSPQVEGRVRFPPTYFEHSGRQFFQGCQDGYETTWPNLHGPTYQRFFVGSDWFVHGYIAHPIAKGDHGQITVAEFAHKLPIYLLDAAEFLAHYEVDGPFAVSMAVRHLQRNKNVAPFYRTLDSVSLPKPRLVERLSDPGLAKDFSDLVIGRSRYGH